MNRVRRGLLPVLVACLPLTAAAQEAEPVLGSAAGAQEESVLPLPEDRDFRDTPDAFDPTDPYLGTFEGSESPPRRRRVSTPADLPRINTILPLGMEPEPGEFPEEVRLGDRPWVARDWQAQTFAWEASGLHHQPLFFEDVALERYGHSFGVLQPAVSFARFNAQAIALPYRLLTEHPCDCEYTLGYYRPGDCAPRLFYRILKKDFGKHRRQRDQRHHFHVVHEHAVHAADEGLPTALPTMRTFEEEPVEVVPDDVQSERDAAPREQVEPPVPMLNPASEIPGKASIF